MTFSACGQFFAVTALVLSPKEHPAKRCTAPHRSDPGRGNERGQVDGRKAQTGEVGLGLGAVTIDESDDDKTAVARQPQQIVDQVLQEAAHTSGAAVRAENPRARIDLIVHDPCRSHLGRRRLGEVIGVHETAVTVILSLKRLQADDACTAVEYLGRAVEPSSPCHVVAADLHASTRR